ncbi:hypothetical protein ASU87_07305 [Enterobacter roggenkampii]|nr:hypothetical protein ASU87_07305 [Enterobacter roggenkampii]
MSIRYLVILKMQFLMFTLLEKSTVSHFKLDIQHIHRHKMADGYKCTTMRESLRIGDLHYIH